jgi:hypothetical protein
MRQLSSVTIASSVGTAVTPRHREHDSLGDALSRRSAAAPPFACSTTVAFGSCAPLRSAPIFGYRVCAVSFN